MVLISVHKIFHPRIKRWILYQNQFNFQQAKPRYAYASLKKCWKCFLISVKSLWEKTWNLFTVFLYNKTAAPNWRIELQISVSICAINTSKNQCIRLTWRGSPTQRLGRKSTKNFIHKYEVFFLHFKTLHLHFAAAERSLLLRLAPENVTN